MSKNVDSETWLVGFHWVSLFFWVVTGIDNIDSVRHFWGEKAKQLALITGL